MESKNVPMSEWEWDGIVNDHSRTVCAEKPMEEKCDMFSGSYQNNERRRRIRIEMQACRYAFSAMMVAAVALFIGAGGLRVLAWILGGTAMILALISAFGFGKIAEMARKKAAPGWIRTGNGAQECSHAPNIADIQEDVK